MLLGGTATSAAEFAFTGVDTNTPVACISANPGSGTANGLAFAGATDSIQSLNRNTLTIGGTTTGDIQFKPGNSSSSLYLASNGNVAIGTTPGSSTFTLQGSSNWGVIDLIGNGTNAETSIGFRSSNVSKGSAGDWVIGANTTNSPIGSFNIVGPGFDALSILTGGNVGINTTAQGNASLVVNQPNAFGDIFSASQSGNTKFVINNAGDVGIGAANPTSPLQITATLPSGSQNAAVVIHPTITDGTNYQNGLYVSTNVNPSTNSTFEYPSIKSIIDAPNGTNVSSAVLDGVFGGVYYSASSGILGTVVGLKAQNEIANNGTITNAYGIDVSNTLIDSGGSVTNSYGILVNNQTSGGTVNTNLALAGTPGSGNYSIYNASSYKNYFAGSLGIGTTSPLATLDVRGNIASTPTASISGATTFAEAVVDQSGSGASSSQPARAERRSLLF